VMRWYVQLQRSTHVEKDVLFFSHYFLAFDAPEKLVMIVFREVINYYFETSL
jgi:hypothetical protein